jgi:hypothetical protein
MKKTLALALCLLSILACAKRPASEQVAAIPPVLPQFEVLNELFGQFQGFRNDQLFLRHGFTANFPQSDWLQQVQDLGQNPELAERARLLASLAVAARIHGDTSRVTRGFEDRFVASLRSPGPALPEEETPRPADADAVDHAEADGLPPQMPVTREGAASPSADVALTVETAGQQSPAQPDIQPTLLALTASEPATSPSAQTPAAGAAATPDDAMRLAMQQAMPAEPSPTASAAVVDARPAPSQEMVPVSLPEDDGDLTTLPQDGTGAKPATPSQPAPATAEDTRPALGQAPLPAPLPETEAGQAEGPTAEADADAAAVAGSPPLPAAEFRTDADVAANALLPSPAPPLAAKEKATGTNLSVEPGPTIVTASPVTPEAGAGGGEAGSMTAHAPKPPLPARQGQTVQAGRADRITIVFTGDTKGLVSPQPGIAGTLGGVARRLPTVERVRAGAPSLVFLDAGDAFASGFPQAQSINKALVRAMNRMRYDALGLGLHDLAMGEVALRELVSISSFPFVCSNLEFQAGAIPWIRPFALLQRGGRKIAVISLLTPDPTVKITGARLIPPRQALSRLMTQLAKQVDAVVLMTQAGREEIAPMIGAAQGVAVILGDAGSGFQNDPRYIPAVPRGMGLTLVELDPTGGTYLPGRSMPLLTSGQQNSNILEIFKDTPQ